MEAGHERERDERDTAETDADGEGVWSADIEQCFREALLLFPPCGRRKHILQEEGGGKMYGRNELIARHIMMRTGKSRTRKQVSSHIQVLARRKAKAEASFAGGHAERVQVGGEQQQQQTQEHQSHHHQQQQQHHQAAQAQPSGRTSAGRAFAAGASPDDRWNDRPIVTRRIRLVEFSAFIERRAACAAPSTPDEQSGGAEPAPARQAPPGGLYPLASMGHFNSMASPAPATSGALQTPAGAQLATAVQFTRHSYVRLHFEGGAQAQARPSMGPDTVAGAKLERIDIGQIQDKFPEIGGQEGLFQRGPADAFFLVKFWADLNNDFEFNLDDQNSFFGFSSRFETLEPLKDITCSTKACSYGLQVVEKVEKVFSAFNAANGRYSYDINRSPMCEFMIQFIKKLRRLPRASQMNSVLENFTVLQVVTNESTSEILLCLAYVFEVASSSPGGQPVDAISAPPAARSSLVYRLVKD